VKGAGTKVESIKSTNDFQCSQAALPVITEGENKLTFAAGPQEGTIVIEGATDVSAAQKNQQLTVSDFHPVLDGVNERLRMTAGKGSATFNVTTPGEMTRLRISAGWRARDAEKDGWEVQASYDGGKTFKTIGTFAGGSKGESGYIVANDVPPGTKEAQVRLAGKQANTTLLFDLRIDADYKEPAGGFKPVKITYHWEEAGNAKSHTHVAKSANDAYSITCGPQTVVKSFTMELAE
jgi:hypothetical protein